MKRPGWMQGRESRYNGSGCEPPPPRQATISQQTAGRGNTVPVLCPPKPQGPRTHTQWGTQDWGALKRLRKVQPQTWPQATLTRALTMHRTPQKSTDSALGQQSHSP